MEERGKDFQALEIPDSKNLQEGNLTIAPSGGSLVSHDPDRD